MTIYILGAGPTGLAVADGLFDLEEYNFKLIEKNNSIGGLASTISWNGIGYHDLGPHKLFTLDKKLMNRVKKLLSEGSWLTKDKKSSIYLNGYFLPYPPSPFSLAKVFGLKSFIRMILGFLSVKILLWKKKNGGNFEEDVRARVGKELFTILFEPIAKKIWGNPKELSSRLSKGRIQVPSILEILFTILRIRKTSNFEALTFEYPKGGLGKIWEAIRSKTSKAGDFILNTEIVDFEIEQEKIKSFTYKNEINTTKIELKEDDFIISTLPILLNVGFFNSLFSNVEIEEIKSTIILNDLMLVFLHVNSNKLLKESWIFVPDTKIIFHRISEQSSFDEGMVKHGSIICCEIMLTPEKNLDNTSNEEIVKRTITDLHKLVTTEFIVLDSKIINLRNSYPVYKEGFENILDPMLHKLDSITNFKSIGRQGSFNYIGTLDAMDIGYGFVEWFKNSNKGWDAERLRTNEYPILD